MNHDGPPPPNQDSLDSVPAAELQRRAERLSAVLNTAVDAIITIDRKGVIDSFNPAAERIFGYRKEEVIGGPVHRLMPTPQREEHQSYIDNYLNTGIKKIIGIGREVVGLRKDGSTFPMDLAVSEIEHQGVFVGIVRDLTARARAEAQLRQADRLASIGSLAAGLGHDMNNVLLPMRGHLDALEAATMPEKERTHLRAIRDSVSYLQQLTDGLHLLALDPLDEEASGLSTDLTAWWEQVGPLLQRSLPRHVRLATSMPGNLPPIAVAPHRLTQIALNLLVNAGHAVGEDGRVRISAVSAIAGQLVRIIVSDNGSGMPPEVKARAFEAFYSTKDRGRGTGLGLALVHGIVHTAGGNIDISSSPGHGTTVTIELPVAQEEEKQRVTTDGAPLAAVISLEDGRIASMMSSFLEDEGLQVAMQSTADPSAAALWITSPHDADISTVQRFLKSPRHQVIACGPEAHEWARLGALVIDDELDFELVRSRIGEALRAIDDTAAPPQS